MFKKRHDDYLNISFEPYISLLDKEIIYEKLSKEDKIKKI
jgi:hypothetical protein